MKVAPLTSLVGMGEMLFFLDVCALCSIEEGTELTFVTLVRLLSIACEVLYPRDRSSSMLEMLFEDKNSVLFFILSLSRACHAFEDFTGLDV